MIGNKVPGVGNLEASIVFVGEGPGENEALQGKPFVGASGFELDNFLKRCVGIRRSDIWITNIVKWRTDENDRDPTQLEIERDRYELYSELRQISPQIIVAVGKVAAQFFLGRSVKMEFVHGLPHWPVDEVAKELGAIIFPVYHPAAGIRQPDRYGKLIWDDFNQLGRVLRGEISSTPSSDPMEGLSVYSESQWPAELLQSLLAVDTEGWIEDPYSIQLCQQEGKASMIMGKAISSNIFKNIPVIGHSILHDLPVIRAFGVDTNNLDLHDTRILSYLLGLYPQGLKALSYRLHRMKMGSYPGLIHEAEILKVEHYLKTAWNKKVCIICEGKGKFVKTSLRKVANPQCLICGGSGKVPKLGKKGQLLKTLAKCECVTKQDVFLKAEVKCPGCTDGAQWPSPPRVYDEDGNLKKPWSISRRLRKMIEELSISSADSLEDDETDEDDEDEADHPLRKRWNKIDPEVRQPVETVVGKLPRTTLRDVKNHKAVVDYACADANATLRDFNKLYPEVKRMGLEKAYDIDRGILPILDRMQEVGMLVDLDYFSSFQTKVESELVVIEDRLCNMLGYSINPGSPDQVANLLYNKLELPPPKLSKKTNKPSADKKSMEALKIQYAFDETLGPIIDTILDYREHAKMLGTYILPIQRLADKNSRIHTQLLYTNTTSGRLASRNINLQNIPTRSELGRQVRKGFIARPGCVLLSVDLDQIELRVGAHLSRDTNMIEIFKSGEDIHRATASLIYKIAADLISPSQRQAAKCFHPDTEVLTKSGWKRIIDLTVGEEVLQATPGPSYQVKFEWTVPLEVFTKNHSSNQLVHLKNEGMDLRVTPDHRMLVWKTNCGKPKVVTPEEVQFVRGWANAGSLDTVRRRDIDIQVLRLAVATQADGSITPSKHIRFGFSKERKINRMRELLRGVEYSEGISKNGKNPNVTWFHLKGSISSKVLELLDSDKTFPWWWLELAEDLRQFILDEAVHWDSCKMPNWRMFSFSSAIRKNVDVLQAIATITNRKTRLTCNKGYWRLTVRDKNNTRGGNLDTTVIPYYEKVACLSVPSSFVLVRDGDSKIPVICGQTANFGIFYGMSPNRLMNELALLKVKISKQEAKEFIEAWFNAYPGVRGYMADCHAEARTNGFVRTMFGRIRYLPAVWSTLDGVREEALRQAGNQPVQGSAGDILKIGMKNVDDQVLPDIRKLGYVEPLVPVHDELIFEVETSIAPLLQSRVEYEMSHAASLLVPLGAKGKTASNWGELKD